MFNLPDLSIFLLAALIFLLTPGPAVLYIVARSLDQGMKSGFVSVLGIEVGNLMHVVATTLGLSAILVSSALAFSIVKYLGAVYLIYLGLRRIFLFNAAQQPMAFTKRSMRRNFRNGVLVAVLNPKTALFFFAFLPQFVDSSADSLTLQLMALGCIFIFMAIVTDGLYALLAGTVGQWLKGTSSFLRLGRYLFGTFYIGLGIMAALSGSRHR